MAHRQAAKPRSPSRNSGNTPSERFGYVLRAKFANSQSAMSRKLGCSQSYLSRVVRGEAQPAAKLLNALAALPHINRHWALTGEGDPFVADRTYSVPVASELLPGPPGDHPEFLTGTYESVAPHLARDSVYLFVVSKPFAGQILAGDRILLDADSSPWTKNVRTLDRKLCAVRRGEGIELRRLRCCFDEGGALVGLHSFSPGQSDSVPDTVNLEVDRNVGKPRRQITLKSKREDPTSEVDIAPQVEAYDLISVQDVMAIAIELWRRL